MPAITATRATTSATGNTTRRNTGAIKRTIRNRLELPPPSGTEGAGDEAECSGLEFMADPFRFENGEWEPVSSANRGNRSVRGKLAGSRVYCQWRTPKQNRDGIASMARRREPGRCAWINSARCKAESEAECRFRRPLRSAVPGLRGGRKMPHRQRAEQEAPRRVRSPRGESLAEAEAPGPAVAAACNRTSDAFVPGSPCNSSRNRPCCSSMPAWPFDGKRGCPRRKAPPAAAPCLARPAAGSTL